MGWDQRQSTCSRFGSAQDGQLRSFLNKAAHRMFRHLATEYEVNALPRYEDESEVSLLRQLDLLREPLKFGQLVGNNIHYTSAESKSSVSPTTGSISWSSALSNFVMRSGKHYAEFNITVVGGLLNN